MAIEMLAVGGWAYTAHGSHLYRLGDEAIGRLTGHEVIYAAVCTPHGRDRYVRLVMDRDDRVLHRAVI